MLRGQRPCTASKATVGKTKASEPGGYGEPEGLGPRRAAGKLEEEIPRVREVSPSRVARGGLPRRRWVVTVVAPVDGDAGGHIGVRAKLGQVARSPEVVWKVPGGTEAACHGELRSQVISAGKAVAREKDETDGEKPKRNKAKRTYRRQLSKSRLLRYSGRCCLPESMLG